ncbi:hypothetical protein QM565_22905 [Geitlerinema splendidum]|nr:hypothetical protein [Geitlerinema splendidum]
MEYSIFPFFSSSQLVAEEIEVDEDSESFTEQLFRLTVSTDVKTRDYILKIHDSDRPLKKLDIVKKSQLIELDLDNENLPPMLPRIAFDVWSGHYEDETGKKHYLSLFKKAPGIPFEQLLDKLLDEYFVQSLDLPSPDKLISYFENWGKALGSLHHKFIDSETLNDSFQNMKTFAIHGDLQNRNFFYDEAANNFTLIDYEDFSKSIRNPLPLQQEFISSLPENSFWQALIIEKFEPFLPVTAAFIKGYSSAWPESSQAKDFILSCLNSFIEKSTQVETSLPTLFGDDSYEAGTSEAPEHLSKFFQRERYEKNFNTLKSLLSE